MRAGVAWTHGGTLAATSSSEETTFTLHMPLGAAPDLAVPAAERANVWPVPMISGEGAGGCSIVDVLFGGSRGPKRQLAVIGARWSCMARADVTFTKAHAPLVLVVEDEIFLRYVTADYLEECGFAVLQAANADEAVGLLQRNRNVGAVFSDIQMPGSMNGLGLARWITETFPGVKVLLTSGLITPAAAQEWTLLAKPYDMAEVERRLREMTA